MTSDANKGITSVLYNHLNIATQITVTGANAGVLDYTYSANGTKLQKKKTQGSAITTTDYAGNYIYENNQLKQVTHTEGYFEPKSDGGYQYVYRYTDIWGNTRITYADDNGDGVVGASEIRREQNYYPFGLEHKGYNGSMYGIKNNLKTYQEQEFTEDLGLNSHEWRYRISDPAIGRFWQIDPLADDYVYNSTYAFQENKIGLGVELEGLELNRSRGGFKMVSNGMNKAVSESTNIKREMEIQGRYGNEAADRANSDRKMKYADSMGKIAEGATEAGKGITYSAGETLDDVGGDFETVLIGAAVFTEGASLTLLPVSEGMQMTGKGLKIAVHVSDGNTEGILKEGGSVILNKALSKAGGKAIEKSKQVGNITTKSEEKIQEGFFAAIGKFFSDAYDNITSDSK